MLKKRMLAMVMCLFFIASATISYAADLRWACFATVSYDVEKTSNGIEWFGDALAYRLDDLTHTEVVVKLQVKTSIGWGTVDSGSVKEEGRIAGVSGVYKNWDKGDSYRVVVDCYAYNGNTVLEHVGPFTRSIDV